MEFNKENFIKYATGKLHELGKYNVHIENIRLNHDDLYVYADISYNWQLNGWEKHSVYPDNFAVYRNGKWLSSLWYFE